MTALRPVCRAATLSATALLLLLAGFAGPARAQGESDLRPDQAVELYDRGDYEAARPILEALDAEGRAGGALLYRLAFCLRAAGDRAGEAATLRRAIASLEQEATASANLEAPFYLANAYRNLQRISEARSAAGAATARVENGTLPEPTAPVELFRLAKLYADQSLEQQASRWYRRALARFEETGERYPAYQAWARRYLGDVAFARADYTAAEAEYGAILDAGIGTLDDYDRLAIARARLESWTGAQEAWRKAEQLDPAHGDRPRYCWRLAAAAAELGGLPEKAPSGEDWGRLSKETLEGLMKEQADLVSEAMRSAAAGEIADAAARDALQAKISAARPVFVKAALEYAIRRYPIRETAFRGGYAPLIFHAARWELPPAE